MRHTLALAVTLLLGLPGPAAAATIFGVDQLEMIVEVLPDASAHVTYKIVFANTPSGQPIDIVDIGMPTDDYHLDGMRAWLDGVPKTDIRHSEFVQPGVEVHLGTDAIGSGERGTFEFSFVHPDLVYQDTTREDLASFQITPTWFGDAYVSGLTDIRVVVYTPAGVTPEEVRYQDLAFDLVGSDGERVMVGWHWEAERLTGPHHVAVSFPSRTMERVITQTRLERLSRSMERNPTLRLVLGLLAFGLWTFAFFRFSGGTGWTVYILGSGGIGLLLVAVVVAPVFAAPASGVLVAGSEVLRHRRKRRYLPPVVQIEGGGIKRGLTAPEAAVILEMPLNKVLTLVLIGLLRKGLVQVVIANPLRLEVLPALVTQGLEGEEARRIRRVAATALGVTLHGYEQGFLWEIERGSGRPVSELDFADELKRLVEHAVERIGGFDLSDTRDYYRHVIRKAIREADALGEEEARRRRIDRDLDWIILDDGYRDTLVLGGWHYHPPWFGDRGGSFSAWADDTIGQVASSLSPISLRAEGLATQGGGVLDLRGVDHVTHEFLQAMAASSGSGGGGGGSGCACAGCACACACAGGGR